MAIADTQFVTGGFQDNFFNLAGQYLGYRQAEKQAEANGSAQDANFNTADTNSRVGAEPVPQSEQTQAQAAQQAQQKQLMLVGAGVVGAVVLFAVLKK